MRLKAVSSIVFGCLVLSGCRSAGPEEALTLTPSSQQVASQQGVGAPVPQVAVSETTGAIGASAGQDRQALAFANASSGVSHFETPGTSAGMPVPDARPVSTLASQLVPFRRGQHHKVYGQRFSDAKPINFGKAAPQRHPVHGVDVSRWQGELDWPTLRKNGANFAFIKATEGGDHLDPMFKANWNAAKAAGVKRGAYHFIYWCRVASQQADWFIRNVPKDPDALPPVIDVEYNGESSCRFRLSPREVREKMQVFMDRLERHYGKRPIIYATPDFYEDNLRGHFRDYPFWLRSVAAHPSVRYPERKWLFWQYSGTGLSQGAGGEIDLNVFYGSENDWQRFIHGKARWDQVAGLR
ncbi:glycoside hydrolase family 25 protein [Peteryoungia desertarenae]|uniref:Glycoside hydrolase family 25 protein n=1 Tax=Peteryoungia desertarenae TaxID=1813451 RepID=A0ABX6QLG9_9HYPH|nr:GH25 family lysozyme [Peteryoungia desertarenae]QLF69324.1 glycoside hydrolase family 25 protein [Peteryoungia desertarenae]